LSLEPQAGAVNELEELRAATALSFEPHLGACSSQMSDGMASNEEEELRAASALSLEPQSGPFNELEELMAVIAFSLEPQPAVSVRSRSRTPERVQNFRGRSITPEPVQRFAVRSVSSITSTHDTDTRFDIEVILTRGDPQHVVLRGPRLYHLHKDVGVKNISQTFVFHDRVHNHHDAPCWRSVGALPYHQNHHKPLWFNRIEHACRRKAWILKTTWTRRAVMPRPKLSNEIDR
jgi:hypothetical protein